LFASRSRSLALSSPVIAAARRSATRGCGPAGLRHDAEVATFAAGLRTPFARYWLSGFLTAALLTGCGGSSPNATNTEPQPSSTPTTVTSAPAARSSTPPAGPPTALPVAPGAGALPQTHALPSTNSPAFRAAMQDLWLTVTTGKPGLALPAFFPLAAYQRVKAIDDPAADWHARLWYDFTLDVGAAHRLVDRNAQLVRVIVAMSDAAWINPGVCANRVGYWHVPGARVVYREHGQERSFGIASLISWRGVWYVVHFGAVLRNVVTGIVDRPTTGPGLPGPPGGC
jgi:hypothetical protein